MAVFPNIKVGNGLFAKVHGRHGLLAAVGEQFRWRVFRLSLGDELPKSRDPRIDTPKMHRFFLPKKGDHFSKGKDHLSNTHFSRDMLVFRGIFICQNRFRKPSTSGLAVQNFLKSGYCGNAEPKKIKTRPAFNKEDAQNFAKIILEKENPKDSRRS